MNDSAMVLRFTVHRYRKFFLAIVLYFGVMVALAQLPDRFMPPTALWLIALPFIAMFFTTVFAFVNMDADFASTTSAYSPYLLRLPVRTNVLVLPPSLAAAAWASALWIGLIGFYMRPHGIDIPMYWPAAMFSTVAVSLQAILWMPVRYGTARLVTALVVPASIVLFGIIASSCQWSEWQVVRTYLIACPIALGCAWYGLVRARTSPPSRGFERFANPTNVDKEVKSKPPFKSADHAQLWLEWKRQGRILPIATIITLTLFSLPLFVFHDLSASPFGQQDFPRINIYVTNMLPVIAWIPLLLATVIGMGARRSDLRGSEGVYHLYYATRPLQNEKIYRANIWALSLGVLTTTGITLGFMLVWLMLPMKFNDITQPYLFFLLKTNSIKDWGVYAGLTAISIAWMWRNQVVGRFVDYLTTRTIPVIYPLLVVISGGAMLVLTNLDHNFLLSEAGWVACLAVTGVIVALKLGTAIVFGMKLLALRPATSRSLAINSAWWLAGAALSIGPLAWAASEINSHAIPHTTPGFLKEPVPVLIGILLVPLARPMIARWALETGRHRA